MDSTVRRLLAVGSALAFVAGCSAATPARDRTIKTHSEPDGRRHPETFDVNANGVVTCAGAESREGDGGCTVRDVSGVPKDLKKGDSMTVSGAGKATFACTGTGAIYCAVEVKD
jgi:hypothetical protein